MQIEKKVSLNSISEFNSGCSEERESWDNPTVRYRYNLHAHLGNQGRDMYLHEDTGGLPAKIVAKTYTGV